MTDNVVIPFPTPDVDGDTWQIAYVRYPGWVDEDDTLYRPMLALAVSATTGQIGTSDMVAPDDLGVELVLAAMDNLAETTEDELPAGYQIGSMEEAVFYFLEAEEAWQQTPGARKWLADAIDAN